VRIADIVDAVVEYEPQADVDLLHKAYVYTARVHQGQLRKSGEPYLNHPLWVAFVLTQMRADVPTIIAGLLHDTIEDTWATFADVEENFGPAVAALVDGVTKLSRIEYRSKEQQAVESYRKMLVAMARDIRVILIKLADRLHNMRTLDSMRPDKQKAIARETLDIYAPLAGRLGIQWLKSELEDLSFKHMEPEAYNELVRATAESNREREAYVDNVIGEINRLVGEAGISAEIQGRPKNLLSIHRKMIKRGVPFDQVYDRIAFRVLVDDLKDCYAVVGILHGRWTPLPGRFKDYIALPKRNRYQSLHTTVIGPNGRPIEIQIRTFEMHHIAEYGVAAHWAYKEGLAPDATDQTWGRWLRELADYNREMTDSDEFVEAVKTDLFRDEAYVFTPAGDVRELPAGSTPLDFAYRIHSEVGNHAQGAKVNGRMVNLGTELATGDIVEIITHPTQHPKRHWLKLVRTQGARQKIRAYLNRQEREQALQLGHNLLTQILGEAGLSPDDWTHAMIGQRALRELGLQDAEAVATALGYGRLPQGRLRRLLAIEDAAPQQPRESSRLLPRLERLLRRTPARTQSRILVDGMDDIETSLAGCCNPLPGDDVVGLVRVGKGIRVHKADCDQLAGANPERRVNVAWSDSAGVAVGDTQTVPIEVESADVPGILARMSKAISDRGINIREASLRGESGGVAKGQFVVDVRSRDELDQLLSDLRSLKGIRSVRRTSGA
jgi:GTP pyrophosphokinase